MKCAEDQCSHVLADDRVQAEIRKMCQEKNFLAPEFIHTCIVEQAGADIMNKFKLVCDGAGLLHNHHNEILIKVNSFLSVGFKSQPSVQIS